MSDFSSSGVSFLCPLHSWTTGEEIAKDILHHRYFLTAQQNSRADQIAKENANKPNCRKCLDENVARVMCVHVCRGVMEGRRGWSVLLKEPAQRVELEGSDFVFDLMSDLELPADFPKHNSYFIISALQPAKVRPNASMWECTHTHTCMHAHTHIIAEISWGLMATARMTSYLFCFYWWRVTKKVFLRLNL